MQARRLLLAGETKAGDLVRHVDRLRIDVRANEPVQRVRQAISEGRIGKPVLDTLVVLGWRGADYYRSDPWRGTWAGEGGGVLLISEDLDEGLLMSDRILVIYEGRIMGEFDATHVDKGEIGLLMGGKSIKEQIA